MADIQDQPTLAGGKIGRRRIVYAAVTILLGSMVVYAQVLPIFRHSLQSYFQIDLPQWGLTLSIGAVCGAVAGVIAGILIDRYGPRSVLRVLLVLVAAAMGLVAASGRRWAMMLAAAGAAYLISRLGLAAMPERAGRRLLLIAPGLLGGGTFIAGILTRDPLWTAAGFVAGAFLWSLEYPAILSEVARRDPSRFGSSMAMFLVVSHVVGFLLIVLIGWVGQAVGEQQLWAVLLIPAAGFPLVGICGIVWVRLYGPAAGRRGG